jgi:6-pyruvoyltetrahydropterin/6-carboxytetrahydropterin synthase
MYNVTVQKTIACAHRLFDYDGPCEELHGHNYKIVVTYAGEQLDRYGMLLDFSSIKKALNDVLGRLDHKYLNDLPEFRDVSPSAENIAAHIYHCLAKSQFAFATLDSVAVWETENQFATYRA